MFFCDVVGRATADAVEKVTTAGKVVRSFSVATDRGYGEQKTTDFMNCVIFAPRFDNMWRFITKGKPLHLRGHLASYKDKENSNFTRWQFVVDDIEFVGGSGKPAEKTESVQKGPESFEEDYGNDIPF